MSTERVRNPSLTLPWRIEENDEFLLIVDPEQQEICRIPKTTETYQDLAEIICAAPWLLMAAKRTIGDLERVAERRDGTTVRQWIQTEGYSRMQELIYGRDKALAGLQAPVPSSYQPIGVPETVTRTLEGRTDG